MEAPAELAEGIVPVEADAVLPRKRPVQTGGPVQGQPGVGLAQFGPGKLQWYLMLTVQTLFSMRTFQANVTTNGETESYENMIFAAAMNLRAEGGGVPMAPESVPDDGKISLSSASGIPKWKTFFLLPLLAMGKQGRIRGFGKRLLRSAQ